MTHPNTAEQDHILTLARDTSDNIMMNALAGCGKTSTLELIERNVKVKPILYLCFNKRNADEATDRMLSTTTVRTFNSLGHRIWAKAQSAPLKLDPKKTNLLFKEALAKYTKPRQTEAWEEFWNVANAVARAKRSVLRAERGVVEDLLAEAGEIEEQFKMDNPPGNGRMMKFLQLGGQTIEGEKNLGLIAGKL